MKRLVIATRNQGKVAELRSALEGTGFEIFSLEELAPGLVVEEDAETFEANALEKARVVSEALHCAAVADDSGLSVDALGGDPGVRSARYGGEGLRDSQRCEALLRALADVPDERRIARFHCVLALWIPGRPAVCFDGVLEGRIDRFLSGEHGFGYDPVFVPHGYDQSLAVLGKEVKQRISHRAQALSCLQTHLLGLRSEQAAH
ncbi:MAG: RdgB/HAM1 family non-canonical purine NTP pyrophosphatase [Myxococcota bacterium]|jgi:XTP/dITP diphosphohydrolase|nr:RdgB/HAM1 family non-canonical purine NTP pyrophosphatase [Myxococcota bacterium]